MKILSLLIFLMGINSSLLAKDSFCNLGKIVNDVRVASLEKTQLDSDPHKVFYKSIEHLSPFKQNLLKKIWEPELSKSKNFIISNDYFGGLKLQANKNAYQVRPNITKKSLNFLAYGVTMPFRVISSMQGLAKMFGLNGTKNYLVLGSKVILTEFIQYPIRNLIYVVSVGAAGEILDSLQVFAGDPLIDESDPSKLKNDEVIAIIKLDKGKASGEEGSILDEKNIAELYEKNPDKYFVVDLSKDIAQNFSKDYREKGSSFLKGKKIKKVIISSHGFPGGIATDTNSYSLSHFGDVLNSTQLPNYFDQNVEIYFNSCLIALNEFGKNQVNEFAEKVIPYSGTVKVNTYYGLSGVSIKHPFKDRADDNKVFSALHEVGTHISPIGKVAEASIVTVYQRSAGLKYKANPFLPVAYTYKKN